MKPALLPVLISPDHPDRAAVEALVRGVYDREYGAKIETFAELMIALPSENGGYLAAAGLRIGNDFFSEIYLDRPIEDLLSDYWRPPAARNEIAEVTTLAASHPHASLALMAGITGHLRNVNVRFAFFTVTERLHMMLKRVGVPAHELAPARIDKVKNPQDWGLYYATNPRVVAIHDAFVSLPASDVGHVGGGKSAPVPLREEAVRV
ncbi:thermostable hemolysin [Magnetovibrio sp.]|uniref:thermostable hemolysin n=1 Tax=Magnetovibrio sp. TaxID=2024836 RepID=UPI002F93BE35